MAIRPSETSVCTASYSFPCPSTVYRPGCLDSIGCRWSSRQGLFKVCLKPHIPLSVQTSVGLRCGSGDQYSPISTAPAASPWNVQHFAYAQIAVLCKFIILKAIQVLRRTITEYCCCLLEPLVVHSCISLPKLRMSLLPPSSQKVKMIETGLSETSAASLL
jgi:hypothetical protein